MLARLAYMTRAYNARVGPLVTRSMTPIRSLRTTPPQYRKSNTQICLKLCWVQAKDSDTVPWIFTGRAKGRSLRVNIDLTRLPEKRLAHSLARDSLKQPYY